MTVEAVDLQELIRVALGCSPEVASAVALHATARHYPTQALMIRYGDQTDHAWLMVAGRAQAWIYTSYGQGILAQEYLVGDLFGAIAGADILPMDTEVVAVEPTSAAAVSSGDFIMLAERHGALSLRLVRSLLAQLREATARMVDRTSLSAPGRVYAELLRLARLGDGSTIRPAPVLAALAVRVQSTRETVSRAVNALERRGIVRRENDAFVIVAAQRLEEMIV